MVEETKNQVAVKRGPIVYCLETADLPIKTDINSIALDINSDFKTETITIKNREVVALDAKAYMENANWDNVLYRPLEKEKKQIEIKLVPYFTWGNRTKGEMTVWMPY